MGERDQGCYTHKLTAPVLAWSFDTSKVETPLFAFLEANGWTNKKGCSGSRGNHESYSDLNGGPIEGPMT